MPLLLRRAMYNLRGGFLVRPLIIALTLGGTGALLSWLEEMFPAASAWVPATIFPSHADPQVAQVILAGIATSMMTVVVDRLRDPADDADAGVDAVFAADHRELRQGPRDAVDAGHLPRNVLVLHGGAAGGAVAAASVCAGGHGDWARWRWR